MELRQDESSGIEASCIRHCEQAVEAHTLSQDEQYSARKVKQLMHKLYLARAKMSLPTPEEFFILLSIHIRLYIDQQLFWAHRGGDGDAIEHWAAILSLFNREMLSFSSVYLMRTSIFE